MANKRHMAAAGRTGGALQNIARHADNLLLNKQQQLKARAASHAAPLGKTKLLGATALRQSFSRRFGILLLKRAQHSARSAGARAARRLDT